MVKSILCPIDFSEASEFGLDYAAHLAQLFSAAIRLVYVRTSIWPESIPLEHRAAESAEDISNRLKAFSRETMDEFRVPCSTQFLATTNTLEETLAELAKECDLIVMGTNGADNYYKYLFGSNAFHLIEKTKCPILVVPTGSLFKPIHSLVYAYHPDTNPIFLIDQLKKFIDPIDITIKVVHVSEDPPSAKTNHKLEILRDAVMVRKIKGKGWSFDAVHSHDAAFALNQYFKNHNGNILALSFHHRQLMEKLFTPNIVRQLTMTADYPVLVFWH